MTGTAWSFVALFGALFTISYLPLPFPLKLVGFVATTLWFCGLRRGGKVLLIGSPLLVSLVVLAYFPLWQRAAGTFIIAYILALFVAGAVGYFKLSMSVWEFMTETRDKLRALELDEASSRASAGTAAPKGVPGRNG